MGILKFAELDSYYNANLLPRDVIHWSAACRCIGCHKSIYGEVVSTFFDWDDYERNITAYQLGACPPPTILEVGASSPNIQRVRVIIPGEIRDRYEKAPDGLFENHAIIFAGILTNAQDVATVKLRNPESIRIVEPIDNLYADMYHIPVVHNGYHRVFDKYNSDGSLLVRPQNKEKGYSDMSTKELLRALDRKYAREFEKVRVGGMTFYYSEDNGYLTELP